MSATLFSKFSRNFDRDVKRLRQKKMTPLLMKMKTQAKVYALSPNASREAGAASVLPPADLLEMLGSVYLPSPVVWVEVYWHDMMEGMFEAGLMTPPSTDEHPVKQGFLYLPLDRQDTGDYLAMCYLVYSTGTTWLCPVIYEISARGFDESEWPNRQKLDFMKKIGVDPETVPLSPAYVSHHEGTTPRLMKRLQKHFGLRPIVNENGRFSLTPIELMEGSNGIPRVSLAVLASVCAAKSRKYLATDVPCVQAKGSKRPNTGYATEVDVFLDPGPAKGRMLRRALRQMESAKKRLHEVTAHWAYRHHKDGRDVLICPKSVTGKHLFEELEGPNRKQECTLCGQKRWIKKAHQRGDEDLGPSPKKTTNVRHKASY